MNSSLAWPVRWQRLCSPLSMRLSGTLMSMPDCTAEPLMSCSFFTVSLPMCSSLLTWSSTLGISTFPAVRVRLVATWMINTNLDTNLAGLATCQF